MPNNILITPSSASIAFSGSAANTIRLQVEPSGSVAFYGNSGSLFSITDSLIGSLMSVNDISGLPILEVFSDDRVVMGTYNRNTLVVTGSRVGIDKADPTADLDISGSVFITGSLRLSSGGITGSIFGTASNADLLDGRDSVTFAGTGSNTFFGNQIITGSINLSGSQTINSLGNVIITGSISASSNGGGIQLIQNTAGSVFNGLQFTSYNGGSNGGLIWNQATGEIRLNAPTSYFPTIYSSGTERLRIDTSGNVGIGTTAPSASLHIQGNVSASSYTSSISNAVGFVGTASFAVSASWAPGVGTSGVTSVTAGSGLSGGTITSTGTIALDTSSVHFLDGVKKELDTEGVVSSSTQFTNLTAPFTGSFTGSFRGSVTGTSSYAQNADLLDGLNSTVFATTGSNTFRGTNTFSGSVTLRNDNILVQIEDTDSTTRYAGLAIGHAGGNWILSAGDNSTGTNNDFWIGRSQDSTNNRVKVARDAYTLSVYSGSNENIILNPIGTSYFSGSVGIGTTTTTRALRILRSSGSEISLSGGNNSEGTEFYIAQGDAVTSYIWNRAVGSLLIGTSNTERIRITELGRVGINNTNPSALLHVSASGTTNDLLIGDTTTPKLFVSASGDVAIGTTSTGARLRVVGSGSNAAGAYIGAGTDNYFDAQNNVFRLSNQTETLRINSSGNVGISTTSPAARLHVSSSGTTDDLLIGSTSNAKLFVSASGNVGIGTTTGTERLRVVGTFASNAVWTDAAAVTFWGSYANARGGLTWDVGFARVYATTGNRLDLGANGSNAHITITGSGNVGIGITSSFSNKLHVQGNVSASSYTSSINNTVGFLGTASWAQNASVAISSSFASNTDGATLTISGSAPTAKTGSLWYDTTTGKTYVYYVSASVGSWVLQSDPTFDPGPTLQSLQDVTDIGNITSNTITITNVTAATNTGSGALIISGGLGVAKDIYANNIQAVTTITATQFTSSAGYRGTASNAVSASFATTASAATSITFTTFSNASYYFPQNLTVEGTLTAQEFYTEFVSSSVIYESGSTKFGNSSDDIHQFTGSLRVLGSTTSSLFGTASWAQSASVAISSSFAPIGPGTSQSIALFNSSNTISSSIIFQSSSNIGIGTVNAGAKLHINDSASATTPQILITNDGTRTGLRFGSSSLAAGTTANIYHRTDTNLADWLLTTSPGSTAQWNFGPLDDSNYAIKLTVPRNPGGTARIYSSTTHSFSIGANNVTDIIWLSGSGNVGIGTTSPSVRLQVSGSQVIDGGLTVLESGSSVWPITAGYSTRPFTTLIRVNASSSMFRGYEIQTGGSRRWLMYADSNPDTGADSGSAFAIGAYNDAGSFIDNPIQIIRAAGSNIFISRPLRVITGSNGIPSIGPTGGYGITFPSANSIGFAINSSEVVRIDSTSNVGIGTTSPTTRLHVSTTSNTTLGLFEQLGGSPGQTPVLRVFRPNNISSAFGGPTTSSAGIYIVDHSSNVALQVSTHLSASLLTVSGSGNVGIGTSNPSATLHIQGNVSASSYTSSISNAVGFVGTSSWAQSSSISVSASFVTTASFASTVPYSGLTGVPSGIISSSTQFNSLTAPFTGSFTGSFVGSLTGTGSWANNAISSSFATTASAATSITFTPTTASYAPSGSWLRHKAGSITNTAFTGNPRRAAVNFTNSFPNTNYAVVITGEDARSWTIEGKVVGGFTASANSNTALTGTTYWVATSYGES